MVETHAEADSTQDPNLGSVKLSLALYRLVVVQGLMNGSHFMAMPLLAVYCVHVLSLNESQVGVVLAVYFLAARVTPVVTAPLADRYGLWPALVLGLIMRGLGFVVVFLFTDFWLVIAASIILGLGTSIYEAGAYGIIGAQPDRTRERLIVVNVQALNVGVVIGPLVGAMLAAINVSIPFIISGLLFLALGSLALFERSPELRSFNPQKVIDSYSTVLSDWPFLLLCIALVPWWALFAQLFAAFPIMAAELGGSAGWSGTVLVVNGAVGFLVLFAGNWLLKNFSPTTIIMVAAICGGVVTGLTGFSSSVIYLLIIVALFTCAEIPILVAAEVLVTRHAKGRSAATFFALFNVSWGVGSAIGGAVGPGITANESAPLLFAALGSTSIVLIAGLLWYKNIAPKGITSRPEVP